MYQRLCLVIGIFIAAVLTWLLPAGMGGRLLRAKYRWNQRQAANAQSVAGAAAVSAAPA